MRQKEQIQIQAIIAFGASILLLLSIFISWITGVYLIGIFAFPLVISIIAPFFDIPSLKKSGKLIYHSPLFLTERKKNGVIKIHGGTLFDCQGKLAFPNLWDTKTFEAQLNDLIKHKKYLEELNDKLKRNLANS